MKPIDRYIIWTWRHNGCFWRDNRAGYTTDINQAGAYSYDEACEILNDGFPGSKIMLSSNYAKHLIDLTHDQIIKTLEEWRMI